MVSIASDHGYFPETLWNHPQNFTIRRIRRDPNVQLPGDRVYVSALQAKSVTVATEMRHRFVRFEGGGRCGPMVRRVFDRELGREACLKAIRYDAFCVPAANSMVRAFRTLAHKNTVAILDLVVTAPFVMVEMEWLGGGTLQKRLAHGSVTTEQAVDWLQSVLCSLSALHASFLSHGRVTSEHVLFDNAGTLKLAGFTVATILEAMADETRRAPDTRPDLIDAGRLGCEILARVEQDDARADAVLKVLQTAGDGKYATADRLLVDVGEAYAQSAALAASQR